MRINSKHLINFLIAPNLIFIALILSLGYFNRFTCDDLGFLYYGKEVGAFTLSLKFYFTWDGRFFGVYITSIIASLLSNYNSLIVFTIITFAGLIGSVYLLLSNFYKYIFIESQKRSVILMFSILFCSCFFYLTFNVGETWFWMNGTIVYLWTIIILLYGTSILISGKNNIAYVLLSSLLFFIYGFSAINYLLITLLLFVTYLVYKFWKNNIRVLGFKKHIHLIIPFFCFVTGMLLMIAAPGNYQRQETFQSTITLADLYSESLSSMKHFTKTILLEKLFYIVVFTMSFFILGILEKNKIKWTTKLIICTILISFVITLCAFIIHSLALAYATGGIGQPRTWTFLSFVMALFCAISGFSIGGYFGNLKPKLIQSLYLLAVVIITAIYLNLFIEQFPIVSKYAETYDKRLRLVNRLKLDGKNDNKTIYLEPLAPSGILFSSELAYDSSDIYNYPYNKVYQKLYGLKFKVLIKERNK